MKQTVLIAMDDSIQSAVAAYLLKKQGLNCIAISIVFSDKSDSNALSSLKIDDLKVVKKICKTIEITHYAVDAKAEFQDKVIDNLVAAKLSGQRFDPIPDMNKIIFDVLLSKMEILKADLISSGHFARIIFNQSKKKYSLGVANDLDHDESDRLFMLDGHHLEKMILPLSDIKYSGVEKISKLIGHNFEDLYEKKKDRKGLMFSSEFNTFVENYSARSLRETGQIRIYGEDSTLVDHGGVHKYYIGQTAVTGKSDSENIIDNKLEVVKIDSHRKTVYLYHNEKLRHTHCQIQNLHISKGIDISLPLKIYFRPNQIGENSINKRSGVLFIKNGESAFLIFDEEQKGLLVTGTNIVFYDRKTEGAKILASGCVKVSGFLYEGRLRELPLTKQEKDLLPGNKLAPIVNHLKF